MFSFNITKKYHKIVHMNWMTSMTVQFVNKSLLWIGFLQLISCLNDSIMNQTDPVLKFNWFKHPTLHIITDVDDLQ